MMKMVSSSGIAHLLCLAFFTLPLLAHYTEGSLSLPLPLSITNTNNNTNQGFDLDLNLDADLDLALGLGLDLNLAPIDPVDLEPIDLGLGSGTPAEFHSAYEILHSYGFPVGLLPQTVRDYSLNDNSGRFRLALQGPCRIDIPDGYPVKYSSKITGTITSDHLRDLSGINVQVLFIWWSISSISVSDTDLVFTVGPFSATYPISNFEQNPGCKGHFTERFSRTRII